MENTEYDFLIIGTSLAHCLLSEKLSKEGHRVLHLDTNSFYGGETSTLTYKDMIARSARAVHNDDLLKVSGEFCIDITPKFLLAESSFKHYLLKQGIVDYVHFSGIESCYIYMNGIMNKVPCTKMSALKSELMGYIERARVVRFFNDVRCFSKNPVPEYFKVDKMKDQFKKFGLAPATVDFIGHALAFSLNNDFLEAHPVLIYNKICQYIASVSCFDDQESPYIYPMFGINELCQAFCRKSSINGTVFALGVSGINIVDCYCGLGRKQCIACPYSVEFSIPNVEGVHNIKAKRIISNHNFEKTDGKGIKQIVNYIFVADRRRFKIISFPHVSRGAQVLFLGREFGRKNDIFLSILTSDTRSCPEQFLVGCLSTVVETDTYAKDVECVKSRIEGILDGVYFVRSHNPTYFTRSYITVGDVDESTHIEGIYETFLETFDYLKQNQ